MQKFPIGFWNYTTVEQTCPEAVEDWEKLGMTLTFSPQYDPVRHSRQALLDLLDACRSRDIGVIVNDSRTRGAMLRLTRLATGSAFCRRAGILASILPSLDFIWETSPIIPRILPTARRPPYLPGGGAGAVASHQFPSLLAGTGENRPQSRQLP